MYLGIREPINAISHFIGAILSLAGLVLLLVKAAQGNTPLNLAVSIVFGISLILLYCSSGIYHAVNSRPEIIAILRKVDHCMIYILIAGTYTPLCLLTLRGKLGTALLLTIWGLAFLGIIIKLVWFKTPRWLSTSFYLLLGWIALFFIYPISRAMPEGGLMLLILGGLLYSCGSLLYAFKPQKLKLGHCGFHEIFHFFIMAGSITHYLLIYHYVLA